MTMNPSDLDKIQKTVATSLHEHWKLFLVEGIVLLVLGAAAFILPQIATLAAALIIGWLFLMSGVVGLIMTFWMRSAPGFLWSLLSAAVAIFAGVVLLALPASGVISLTYVLIAFFLIEGIATIMFALDHRRELSGKWGWMLMSGVIDLVLGGIILAGLPLSATWALGLLVGINMMFGGASLIAMALHARAIDPAR